MKIEPFTEVNTDVLIIGAGGAGLRAAIEARKQDVEVIVACKSRAGLGNCTAISKAGFAAAVNQSGQDNPNIHLHDTIIGGCYLNNRHIVQIVTRGAPSQVSDLQSFGVDLDTQDNKLSLLHVPGHTYPRQVHCRRPLGVAITIPMRDYAIKAGVKFMENILLTRLLVKDGTVIGAAGIDKEGKFIAINASSIIIATGGLGQIYLNTNNTVGTTGDGYTLAYEAGASLADMEFIQFYPTAIGTRGSRIILYEILVFREGGIILNALNEDVLEKYNLRNGSTMTRDRVSRVIMQEILDDRSFDGKLVLDFSGINKERRNSLQSILGDKAISAAPRLKISPTAHYAMGGIIIDGNGNTGVSGLFAAGEVCSGMHGANRLGGNAITEILVMGAITGRNAAERVKKTKTRPEITSQVTEEINHIKSLCSASSGTSVHEIRDTLKKIMWYKVGIIRRKENMKDALSALHTLEKEYSSLAIDAPRNLWQAVELHNMLAVSNMVCNAALEREESRGSHYRDDFPQENNQKWLKNIVISRQKGVMDFKYKTINGNS